MIIQMKKPGKVMIKKSKILIVDDEARMCASLKTLLCAQDYEIQTCCSGNEALNYLDRDEFDLVIMDVFMEGMDGFQVIEEIMKQKIDTPVIIMTGSASTESAVKALRMGASNYLKKPFESEELFLSVTNVLSQRMLKEKKQLLSKKLKESEKKYKTLVNTTPQGIQLTDLDGKIIFSNPAHHKIHGYPKGGLIGKYIWELIAKESDKIKTKKYYKNLIRNQPKPESYYTLDRTKNGELIYSQINWDYIRDSKENLTGIISIISDITKRRRAENALRESEKKYRHLFKNAPAGIYEIDFEKVKFINVNEVMCKYSGYSEEEFLSMNPLDLLTEDSKNLFIERLEKLSKEKNMTRNVEYNIIKKNGQTICVILNSDFIYEKDKLIGARVVAHDISELKQAQIGREKLIKALQEAFESIKTLTGLLPICSHCKKIRDDKGYWNQIEGYIQEHSDAQFSHGICPECSDELYGKEDWYIEMKKEKNEKK